MKIAVVAPSLDILGGQGVQAALLVDALRGDGQDASLLPVNPRFPRGLRWLRRYRGVRTIVNQLIYIPALLKLVRADVVHVFSASYWSFLLAPVPAMLVARAFGKRVVLHYHSGEAAQHLATWGAFVHPWLRLAHDIVVPSEYLRAVFGAHGYSVRVIPNFVMLSDFSFRLREPLQPRLLSLRNLEPYYRVDVILEAFALLRRHQPAATLLVAGAGSEERALRAQAERLGIADAVRFIGRVEPSGVPALFEQADVFVNTSVLDNQPVSILEAFAAGTPVVTTPPGDIPAMVTNGETGRLVTMADPVAVAETVLDLIENPKVAARMATNARRALQRFSWPAVRDAWQRVYRREEPVPSSTLIAQSRPDLTH